MSRRFLAILAIAALAVAAPRPTVAAPPLYVVVPFGEPGDDDPQQRIATDTLAKDLSDQRIRSAIAAPLDAIEAVGKAPDLCREFGAGGVLVGGLSFQQSKERNLTGFIPVVGGVVSSSGVFDASPIRARVKLFLVDCRGRVAWKTFRSADKVHHGQNVRAGLTEIEKTAIDAAVQDFAAYNRV